MKKFLLISGLTMISGFAAAQEVGKVISSTPVARDTGVQQQCAPDASSRDACRSAANVQNQTVGYKVVYEYAGKRYTTQMAEKPGKTINLQISPAASVQPAARTSTAPVVTRAAPIYEDRWDVERDRPYRVARSNEGWDADYDRSYTETVSARPRYVERVYVEPSYYPSYSNDYPSYSSYNNSAYLPLLGFAIGYASGHYGYGRHDGHGGYGGHYGHRSHFGHSGHRGHYGNRWR